MLIVLIKVVTVVIQELREKKFIQSLTYIKHINTQLGTSKQITLSQKKKKKKRVGMIGHKNSRYSRSLPENATTQLLPLEGVINTETVHISM